MVAAPFKTQGFATSSLMNVDDMVDEWQRFMGHSDETFAATLSLVAKSMDMVN